MICFPFLAISLIDIAMQVLAVLFGLCCIVLVLVILIQKGKGGGLSSAFGGGMGGGLLGSKTGDFLTWVTIVVVGVFLSIGVLMAKFYRPPVDDFGSGRQGGQQQSSGARQEPEQSESAEPEGTDAGGANTPGS
jgi:preprotein translocase subunit SecG